MSGFMKYYYVAIIGAFLASSVLMPRISAQNLPINQCVTAGSFDTNKDYFPDKVTIENATLFSVQYFNNYKLVTNKQTNEIFALYQCGTPAPTNVTGAKLFQISVNNVAVTDTSVIPFLDFLGYRSTIKFLDPSVLVSSPCVQSAENSGDIKTLSTNQTLDEQELQSVDVTFGAFEANPNDTKSVSIAAVSDPGSLNRVEWIKFFSVFYNAESKSNDVYEQIKSNYECFKTLVSKNSQGTNPIVAWVSYNAPADYNQNTPSWEIADAVYKKQFTEDAGGIYFNLTTLTYNTSTDFLNAIENVDILIDETYIGPNISDFYNNFGLNASQQQYKFIKNQAIYREDGVTNQNDGRDWLEDAIAMGDAVLEDLINVINPKLPKSDYNRIWFRNIAKDEQIKVLTANDCSNPNQPLVSKADNCSAISTTSTTSTTATTKSIGAISSIPSFYYCSISFIFVNLAVLLL